MRGTAAWTRSTVGQKTMMGLSGFLLFGFVLGHMAGNLKAFQGAEKFNAYAEWIRDFGAPMVPHEGFLWAQRIVLLGIVVLHAALAYQLTKRSRKARPHPYKQRPDLGFLYASRTMRWGGVIVGTFIVYHVLHLTVGAVHSDFTGGDAYRNLVIGLSNPFVAIGYAVAVTALCMHLHHGLWSATQTLGFGHGRFDGIARHSATAFAGLVWLGFVVVPLGIQLGIIAL